jgi:hypothetical protein
LPGGGRDAERIAKHIASGSHAHRVVPRVDVEVVP